MYSKRSKVLRFLKFATTSKKFDKVISSMAFDPPKCSYRFDLAKRDLPCNVRLVKAGKNNRLADLLSRRGMSARGDLIETKNYGKIPIVVITPEGMALADCADVMLFSHGTSVDIGLSFNAALRLLDRSIEGNRPNGIVLWDYPGYGLASNKSTCENSVREGVKSVHEHLTQELKVPSNRIVAIGFSIGSVPTTYLASLWKTHPLRSVALISPIASAYHVFTGSDPQLNDPVGSLSNVNRLGKYGSPWPTLLFHGDKDTFISMDHGKAILKTLQGDPTQNDPALKEECSKIACKTIANRERIYCQFMGDGDNTSSTGLLWTESESVPAIPFSHSQSPSEVEVESFYQGRISLVNVPGAGHNDILANQTIYDTIFDNFTHTMKIVTRHDAAVCQ